MTFRLLGTVAAAAVLCASLPDRAVAQQRQDAAHPDHMEHRFDNADEWAKSFDDPARDQWQLPDRVISELRIQPGAAVADIGAGTGYFTIRLAKLPAKPKVFAVDIEPSMLEHIQHRAMLDGL